MLGRHRGRPSARTGRNASVRRAPVSAALADPLRRPGRGDRHGGRCRRRIPRRENRRVVAETPDSARSHETPAARHGQAATLPRAMGVWRAWTSGVRRGKLNRRGDGDLAGRNDAWTSRPRMVRTLCCQTRRQIPPFHARKDGSGFGGGSIRRRPKVSLCVAGAGLGLLGWATLQRRRKARQCRRRKARARSGSRFPIRAIRRWGRKSRSSR